MRTLLTGAVLVLALGSCSAQAAELNTRRIQKASSAAMAGRDALKAGDLSRASQLFEEALSLVPNLPEARMGLGHVAFARQHFSAALDQYTAARDEMMVMNQAALDREQLRFEEAQRKIRDLRDEIRGLRAIPSANVDQDVRDLESRIAALELIRRPSRSRPEDPPAEIFFYRGNALFRLGRLQEAVADWTTCERIDPQHAAVHNNLAVAHWKLGHSEIARAELADAKRLGAPINPDFEQSIMGAPRSR